MERCYSAVMLSLQAFRFELVPTGEQVRNMRRFAGSCRVVWNKALARQQEIHAAGGKFVNYVGMAKWLTEWRQGADLPWMKETPVHAQQQTLRALELAYKSFFDGRMDAPASRRTTPRSRSATPTRNSSPSIPRTAA